MGILVKNQIKNYPTKPELHRGYLALQDSYNAMPLGENVLTAFVVAILKRWVAMVFWIIFNGWSFPLVKHKPSS